MWRQWALAERPDIKLLQSAHQGSGSLGLPGSLQAALEVFPDHALGKARDFDAGLHLRNAGQALSRKRVKSQDERGHPIRAASLRISDVSRLANLQKSVAFSD